MTITTRSTAANARRCLLLDNRGTRVESFSPGRKPAQGQMLTDLANPEEVTELLSKNATTKTGPERSHIKRVDIAELQANEFMEDRSEYMAFEAPKVGNLERDSEDIYWWSFFAVYDGH